MASVSFYEEMGFIRVGAIARYLPEGTALENNPVEGERGSRLKPAEGAIDACEASDAHPLLLSSSTVATATGQPPTSRSSSSLATRLT